MTVATIDELRAKVGDQLGTSEWLTIDQAAIDTFASVTHDEQWIHVDRERAAAGPFGGPIAHGYLTLSLCAYFLRACLEVRGASMAINYGLDRVRFPAPVPVGARVRGNAELASIEDVRGGGVQAVVRITVEREGSERPVCVAEVLVRYQR